MRFKRLWFYGKEECALFLPPVFGQAFGILYPVAVILISIYISQYFYQVIIKKGESTVPSIPSIITGLTIIYVIILIGMLYVE